MGHRYTADVIEQVKLADPGVCPRWCNDQRPGVHAHDVLDALRNGGFHIGKTSGLESLLDGVDVKPIVFDFVTNAVSGP